MPAVARPQESLHRIFFNFSFIFWNLCLVVLGLCCCARAYSGCHSGSYFLLWHMGFSLWRLLSLQSTGSRCLGFSSYGSEARWWWCTGLVAPWCVDSSWIRYQIRVPCIGRQILNHWKGLTTLPNHQGNLTGFLNDGNSWVLKWAELRISHCFGPSKTLSSIFARPAHLSLSSSPS